jgi:hypothetical protein
MKNTHLAEHDSQRPYLIQWTNVDRADERAPTIDCAISRMVAVGFESSTYRDAGDGHGFHHCAEFSPIGGWRYVQHSF